MLSENSFEIRWVMFVLSSQAIGARNAYWWGWRDDPDQAGRPLWQNTRQVLTGKALRKPSLVHWSEIHLIAKHVVYGLGIQNPFRPAVELFRRCIAQAFLHTDVEGIQAESLGELTA